MSNILIVPNSGSIYFSTGLVGSSTIPNLSSGVAFQFDNSAGVNITSYATGVNDNDRFSVDGYNGRLFNVSDNLTGVIFSVNDAAGLPIIEVDSSTVDKITMGTYASNTFVINDNRVGIGTGVPAAKLDIFDNVLAGSAGLSGSILNLNQTWNTTGAPTAIKLNVTDTASNAASNLLDLQISGLSKFSVRKDGRVNIFGDTNTYLSQFVIAGQPIQNSLYISAPQYIGLNSPSVALMNGGIRSAWWTRTQGISITSSCYYAFSSHPTDAAVTVDTILLRDTAATLALRDGVNPQAFRLYNTYTSSTNFERLNLRWDTNVVKIGTEKGSAGGVARDLVFETDATGRMTIAASGDITFSNPTQVRTALGFVQITPSGYADLVASGIANPDTIYIVQE